MSFNINIFISVMNVIIFVIIPKLCPVYVCSSRIILIKIVTYYAKNYAGIMGTS